MSDNLEPWDDCGWTRARYFSFIRSNLRKCTMRYPAIQRYLQSQCRPAPKGSRAKQVVDCEICGKTMAKSHAIVDHIIPAGSLRCYEDIEGFITRLFCGSDGFQILCQDPCHAAKTLADKRGITFEEALKEKPVIAFTKLSVAKQKAFLKKHKVKDEDMSNQEKRTASFRKLKGNNNV